MDHELIVEFDQITKTEARFEINSLTSDVKFNNSIGTGYEISFNI